MMFPGMTISPPNFLTPSRRPALSRPLRDEPPAFLCAICRCCLSCGTDRAGDIGDAQNGLMLAVSLLSPIVVPPFLLEDDDLGRPRLLDHRRADRSAIQKRRAGGDLGTFADHQHFAEFDRGAGLARQLLDRNNVVLGDFVLFAAGADDCEHYTASLVCRTPAALGARMRRNGRSRSRAAQYRRARRTVNHLRARL